MLRPAEPARQLKPFIRKYVHLEVPAADSVPFWPIPARSVSGIEFTFGEPYRIHHVDGSRFEIARPTLLIGAKTHQKLQLELCGHIETMTILFQPTGLQRVFSLPGGMVVNEHYEADSVLGQAMAHLWLQLGEARTFEERVQIADRYFTVRIPSACEPSSIDAAVRGIISKQGCVRVPDLARETGLGLRQFERRFVADLGISPKLFARIVRFEAAIQKKAASPRFTWTQIAHELNYHDQMHMVHDFHRLSDENPTSLAPHFELLSSISAKAEAW